MKQQTSFKGIILLLLTALIWGISFVAQSEGMESVDAFTFQAIRTLLGAAVLVPVIIFRDRNMSKSMSEEEKVQIAERYLIPKQIAANGLKKKNFELSEKAIRDLINYYTRESGVRDLERKIASCLRKVAVAIVKEPKTKSIKITPAKVKEYLGTPIFEDSKKEVEPQVGVVTGLAYTQYGGSILF